MNKNLLNNDEFMDSFVANLKRIMEEKKMTAYRIGKMSKQLPIKITSDSITKILNGSTKSIAVPTLLVLASILEVKITELIKVVE